VRWSSFVICGIVSAVFTGCGTGHSIHSVIPDTVSSTLPTTARAQVFASTASGISYTSLVMNDSPLAFYRFNDGTSVMTDGGPNHLNGSFGANVRREQAALTSSHDYSAALPGSAARSSVPANTGTVPANALFARASSSLTVEAWVKPAAFNQTNNYVGIAAYGFGAIGNTWALSESPQSALDLYLKVNGGGGSYELSSGNAKLLPGQIYQVVATYDGKIASLYIDGFLVAARSASGSLNYAGLSPQYGLAVGGELGISRPTFNGAVSDVAIYPAALSASDIETHFLAGQLVQPFVETPTGSDVFVDSIGVDTHLRSTGTQYTNNWATFLAQIKASGIRHIGDALIASPSWYPQRVQQLASSGIHANLITDLSQTAQAVSSAIAAFGGSIETVQGPNEVDLSGDANWISDTRAFQKMLWSTVKGNAKTEGLKVIGPSVVYAKNDTALGSLSAYMDEASMHDYFSGFNPGTPGWGGRDQYGIYGSIAWNMNVCAVVSGTKPVMATESGYSSSPLNSGGVDSKTLGKYILRTYLNHFLNGIPRTTLYEFYDEPGNTDFNQFGLVDANNVPRSSYYAIKSLIGLLADSGAAFTPKAQSYVLTGNMTNIRHLLLQKRDGTNELIVWVEARGYDQNTKTDIPVAPQSIILQPAALPLAASASTIGDSGNVAVVPLTFSSGATSLSVDDHVTVITFK
jgi:hypothetical protein